MLCLQWLYAGRPSLPSVWWTCRFDSIDQCTWVQKSDGTLAEPDKCWTDASYLLSTDRNVDTRGLMENSPWHSFLYACTHGLLSVRTEALWFDCTVYGLKCLIAEAIDSASISHGNHVTRQPPSLVLKKPASFSLSFCMAYIVAPMPHPLTDPSVTIHSPSSGCGKVCSVWV